MAEDDEASPARTRSNPLEEEPQDSLWRRRVKPFLGHITVEPMLFFHAASFTMIFVMSQSLKLSKTCRVTYNQTEEICRNLTGYPQLELSIQRSTSDLGMYFTIIQTVPSITFALFVAPWSDRLGRKIFMIISLVGAVLGSFVLVFASYFEDLPPEFLLLAPAITSITGDFAGMTIAVFSYITDLTKENSRTMRMGFVTGIWLLGSPVGSAIGGILITYTSHFIVFIVCTALLALCLIYIIIRVKDVHKRSERNESILREISSNFKESVFVCFLKRPANRRFQLWLLAICMCGVSLPIIGELNARFLYAKLKFNWKDETYSYYMAVSVATSAFGIVAILPILSNKVKLKDITITLIALTARIITDLLIIFSNDSWMMFVSVLPIVGECAGTPIRSLISKCIAENEVGKIFSLLAIVEVGVPLISGVIYSRIYNATVHLFPATVFVVSIALYIIVIATLILLHFDMKQVLKKEGYLNGKVEETAMKSTSVALQQVDTSKSQDHTNEEKDSHSHRSPSEITCL